MVKSLGHPTVIGMDIHDSGVGNNEVSTFFGGSFVTSGTSNRRKLTMPIHAMITFFTVVISVNNNTVDGADFQLRKDGVNQAPVNVIDQATGIFQDVDNSAEFESLEKCDVQYNFGDGTVFFDNMSCVLTV